MTLKYDDPKFKEKHAKFDREYRRVEPYKSRKPLTQNKKLKLEYRQCLVQTYNDIIKYLVPIERNADSERQLEIQNLIVEYLRKLKECFCTLKLEYPFGKSIFDRIDIEKITESEINTHSIFDSMPGDGDDNQSRIASGFTSASGGGNNTNLDFQDPLSNTQNGSSTPTSTIGSTLTRQTITTTSNSTKMAQTPQDFIALANRIIPSKFNGDPLALDSFIDSVKLLNDLCEQNNKGTFMKFLLTRLEGEAREVIEEEPIDADDLIDELKEHLKPASSKVIAGRMLALRADKLNLTRFSERAEELAEQYRRSLCKEGFSKEKAKELAIEKTVDLCRVSARNGRVQSIIAATAYTEPKEVIAKMIIEINNLKLDRNSVQYKSNHKYNKNNQNNNGGNKFSHQKNGNFHSNRNSGASTSQGGNSYRQNSQNNGNYSRGRNNYNNQNSRTFTNSNYSKKQNDQSVRFYSGNEMNPGNGGQTSDQP